MGKIPEPDIYQQEYERQEAARLAGAPMAADARAAAAKNTES
jgi:hypothetical protein